MNIEKENISRIADYIRQGEKKSDGLKEGLEYEHIIVNEKTDMSVGYFGSPGIEDILKELSGLYEKEVYLQGRLIGLERKGVGISVEPASQFELSIAPYSSVFDIMNEYETAMAQIIPVLKKHGLKAVYRGYHPASKADDMPLTPKERYKYMYEHFSHTGTHGKYMMKGSCAVQLSIDYTDERDFAKKFKLAQILGAVFAFICDNTPVFEGEEAKSMMRTRIWDNTDPARCGVVPNSFKKSFGYEAYARYIYSAPALYSFKSGTYSYTGDAPLSEVFADKLMENQEIEHALGMVFPYCRAKKYIEMRNADCMPPEYTAGYIALIKGIFYNMDNLSLYSERFDAFTQEDYTALKADLFENGWNARLEGEDIASFVKQMLINAKMSLGGEAKYLEPFEKLAYGKKLLKEGANIGMENNALETRYIQLIKKDRKKLYAQLEPLREVFSREALLYARDETRFLLCPKMITEKTEDDFRRISEMTYRILSKVTERYISDAEYRKLFGFDEQLEKLILSPCAYSHVIPIMRADIFYDEKSGDFMFCEINTDGTSAMKENCDASDAFIKTDVFAEFTSQTPLKKYELFDKVTDEILEVYAQSGGTAKRPTVAITDFTESATIPEFEAIKQVFEAKGVTAIVADVRQFTFKKNYLYFADKKIDIIYRRAVTDELMNKKDEIEAFMQALVGSKTCIVGHTKTQIAHNKVIFSVLFRPETKSFLTREESDFIDSHVPYTTALTSGGYDYNEVLLNKDEWVIKPADMYGAKNVCVGCELTDAQWEQALKEGIKNDYLLQRYCVPYKSENMYYDKDGQLIGDTFNNLTGLYIFGGKFSGVYSRASVKGIISGPTGGFTLCSMAAEEQ